MTNPFRIDDPDFDAGRAPCLHPAPLITAARLHYRRPTRFARTHASSSASPSGVLGVDRPSLIEQMQAPTFLFATSRPG